MTSEAQALTPEISMAFIYRDVRGNVTARYIEGPFADLGDRVEGTCTTRRATRTFVRDRILELITDETDVDARLAHWREAFPVRPRSSSPQVLFTGFSKTDKERLEALARAHGLNVGKGVTNTTAVLVCGENAGPKKIERARELGATILVESEFIEEMGAVEDSLPHESV